MKSTVETLSPTRVRLDIEVPYADLTGYVADAYTAVSKKVNIPGFRKGKVPAAMIDQRVGRGSVIDEAINNALPEFYGMAAREHSVLVVGRPEVEIKEYVDNEKLVFAVEVDVRPEVTLPDFSKITIEVDDVAVTDKDIDEQVDELRARFGTLNTVERETKDGDFVTVDLTAKIDGAEVDGGKANDISYEVGSNRMIDGLDAALVGMKAGDVKNFETQLVGQKDDEKGDVEIKLKAVKERELPPKMVNPLKTKTIMVKLKSAVVLTVKNPEIWKGKVVDPKIAKFVAGGPISAYETYPSIVPLKKGKTTVSFTDGKKTYFLKLTVL